MTSSAQEHLTWREYITLFSKVMGPLRSLTSKVWTSVGLGPRLHLSISIVNACVSAHLVAMKPHFFIILILFLWYSGVNILFLFELLKMCYFVCGWVFCLCAYLYISCVPGAQGGQRRVLGCVKPEVAFLIHETCLIMAAAHPPFELPCLLTRRCFETHPGSCFHIDPELLMPSVCPISSPLPSWCL